MIAALTQEEAGSYTAGEGDRKIDCYQIWEQITHGNGPESLDNGRAAAGKLKGTYESRMSTIDDLIKEMDAAWTGNSADAAKSGAHPLKKWMEDSRTKLQDSDKFLGEQRSAFTTVHSKVQEVPQKPPESSFLNDITPWETDTDRAIKEYNEKGQANVEAFNEYFKASNENAKGMPTYSQMEGQVQNVGVDGGKDGDRDGDGIPDSQDPNPDQPGGGGGMPGGGGGMPGGGGGMPGGGMPGGAGMPGGVPGFKPGEMPGGGYKPPEFPGAGGNMPGGGYKPPAWDDGTSAAGYTPPKMPSADFGPGGGRMPGGVPGGGMPGGDFGPGGAGFGPGGMPGAGFGPGGTQSGAGAGPGAGAGGARPGGIGAGGAGAGGRPGAMGGMGMGGMGAGAGRGQGAEDEERQSRFLVGDDPNEVFGTDELTAPPVIGE
ncbi:PPE domain-containing protein [Amycolatopsis suaedae]|uniref:PPE domain-containing protein n=1 Tax=Amycolatopsis suaedae TaxID=2510978 RepID=A0A4Q7JDF1_9PSEU|nr:PPE domain-containing protein [Amycolatopsis suaedae]